jgi:putative phosphoribosyl transferase
VVSRGGRPDLAGDALERFGALVRLIVSANDAQVLALNKEDLQYLHCEKDLIIIPSATHLFEEPGTPEAVALSAANRFVAHPA